MCLGLAFEEPNFIDLSAIFNKYLTDLRFNVETQNITRFK